MDFMRAGMTDKDLADERLANAIAAKTAEAVKQQLNAKPKELSSKQVGDMMLQYRLEESDRRRREETRRLRIKRERELALQAKK